MKVIRKVLEPLDNNCYILINNGYALIVDPSSEQEKIESVLNEENVELVGILVTHYHYDHVGALDGLVKKYKVNVYDYKSIGNQKIKNFKFEVIPTKGHSIDSVSFYFKDDKNMFVGDFIFYETIGRTDLKGGDDEEMAYSLSSLKKMPKDINLYPGHGYKTTLEHELECNVYLWLQAF